MIQSSTLVISECGKSWQCTWVQVPLSVFAVSLGLSYLIVATKKYHGQITLDQSHGIQKIHNTPTPRVGGVGIFFALVVVAFALRLESTLYSNFVIALIPAFSAGLIEDLTKRVNPGTRLFAILLSGVSAYFLTGYRLSEIGISLIDPLFSILWFSVVFSAFAVAGVANAFNIIDGCNGLAGFTAKISFLGILLVALRAEDMQIAHISLIFSAATLGFICLNWPGGRLFLGDGGSYAIGFAIGWLALMLVERNSQVSPFAGLLVCIYPITEVLFSIVRRHARNHNATSPDRLHMHSLLGRRYVNRWFSSKSTVARNSITGISMAVISLPSTFLVQYVYNSTLACLALCLMFVMAYVLLYRRMVRFRW